MSNIFKKYKNVFMIGIGGISMSGLAEILKYHGINVSGSNTDETKITNHLNDIGIPVITHHDENNINNQDLVIYTAAISEDNPELKKARELNIPTLERSTFVGELTKCFKDTICVSGTHGKSTTTGMITSCFLTSELDPTVQIGAEMPLLKGNYRVGNSDYLILEACEYVDSFLKFHPKCEVILNIDNDHLNYFKNLDNIKNSFTKYVNLVPSDGFIVVNDDDENCKNIYADCKGKVITYGLINKEANYYADNISFDELGYPTFDVYHNGNFYLTATLGVLGNHNISNALAAIALCSEYKIPKNSIKEGLRIFTGVNRRFEYIGTLNDNILVYDDYAHHPTEIKATLDAVKKVKHNNSWVVFQPHTYSRTYELYQEMGKILSKFDNIIIAEIYAAREINTYNICEDDLVNVIKSYNKNVQCIKNFKDIATYLKENAKANDLVITIGAGPINEVGLMLLKKENN